MRYLLLLCTIFIMTLSAASAQTNEAATPISSPETDKSSNTTDNTPDSKPDLTPIQKNMPDPTPRQIKESKALFKKCNDNDTMSKRHDCECLALDFMEKRIEQGDSVKSSVILSQLRNSCLKPESVTMKDTGYEDMSGIPQEIIDETNQIFKDCQKDWTMSTYQDCECLAGKFMDDRIKLGPSIDSNNIIVRYKGLCRNDIAVAGYKFKHCMENSGVEVPSEFKPKYYCECFASEFAKKFKADTGEFTVDTVPNITTYVRVFCSDKLSKNKKYLTNP